MNECMNERMNERMKKCMNECLNECLNESVNEFGNKEQNRICREVEKMRNEKCGNISPFTGWVDDAIEVTSVRDEGFGDGVES